MSTLYARVTEARKHIRAMKRVSPYLFNAYHELNDARDALDAAQKRYDLAKRNWDQLGAKP